MVKHGFERPGHGYLVGECWGVGHPPLELDVKITKHWRQYLVAEALPGERKHLADLRSGKIKEFLFTVRIRDRNAYGLREEKTFFLTEGEPVPADWPNPQYPPDFKWARKSKITETERAIKEIEADIVHLGRVIASWKYSPEKLQPKTKGLTEGQSIRAWFEGAHAELSKLPAPSSGPGKGANFYDWAMSFPRTLAWVSMGGVRKPSYYKFIREAYEKVSGAAPLSFERGPRPPEILSREAAEKQAARDAKAVAKATAMAQKSERAAKMSAKALEDIAKIGAYWNKAYFEHPRNIEAAKAQAFNVYGGRDDPNRKTIHDAIIDLVHRGHQEEFLMGKRSINDFAGKNPVSVRKDLRDNYDVFRQGMLRLGIQLERM
jgi:hypothetical protein